MIIETAEVNVGGILDRLIGLRARERVLVDEQRRLSEEEGHVYEQAAQALSILHNVREGDVIAHRNSVNKLSYLLVDEVCAVPCKDTYGIRLNVRRCTKQGRPRSYLLDICPKSPYTVVLRKPSEPTTEAPTNH